MWVIFDKFGKIIKSLDIDCPPARLGTTDFKIFAIFLDQNISDCSATITFEKPDYDKNKYYPFIMRSTTHELTPSLLDKDAVDYAPLELNKEYDGFEFDFEKDATGVILLDTHGEWKYTIDLYKGTLADKRYIYFAPKNVTIDGKKEIYELLDAGTTKEYKVQAKLGYKLPKNIIINLDAGQYVYTIDPTDKTKGTIKIVNMQSNIVCEIIGKEYITHTATFNLTHCDPVAPIVFDEDDEITVKINPVLGYKLPSMIVIVGENDYTWSIDTTTREGTLKFTAIRDVTCEIIAVGTDGFILKIECYAHTSLDSGDMIKQYVVKAGNTQRINLKTDGSTGYELPEITDTANFKVNPISEIANITYTFVTGKTTATLDFLMNNKDTTIKIYGVI